MGHKREQSGVRLSAGLAGLLVSAGVVAQSGQEDHRAQAIEGFKAYEAEDYRLAAELLSAAVDGCCPYPTVAYHAGVSFEHLARLAQAVRLYRRAMELPATDPSANPAKQQAAQQKASERLRDLEKRTPRLTVVLQSAAPAQVTVLIDGVPLDAESLGQPRLVDPGQHEVTGQCRQQGAGEPAVVVLAEREGRELVLDVPCTEEPSAPKSAAPTLVPAAGNAVDRRPLASTLPKDTSVPSPTVVRIAGWSAVGVGGAGVVLCGVAGLLAYKTKSRLEDDGSCDSSNRCDGEADDDREQYNSLRTASAIGFWVGVPLLAAGVGALLWQHSRDQDAGSTTRTEAWVGVGAAGLRARF